MLQLDSFFSELLGDRNLNQTTAAAIPAKN